MTSICVMNITNQPLSKDDLPDANSYDVVDINTEPDNLTLAEAKREVSFLLDQMIRLPNFNMLTSVYIISKPNRNDIAMILYLVSALSTIQILPKIWVLNGMRGVYMDISDFVVDGSYHLAHKAEPYGEKK